MQKFLINPGLYAIMSVVRKELENLGQNPCLYFRGISTKIRALAFASALIFGNEALFEHEK